MLYFYLEGGLCNRLRVISAAYHFYKDQKLEPSPIFLWPLDNQLGCRFDDLFQESNDISVINFDPETDLLKVLNFLPKVTHYFNEQDQVEGISDLKHYSNRHINSRAFDLIKDLIAKKENVLLKSNSLPYPSKTIYLPPISQEIQTRINNNTKNFYQKDIIGVHIRRTDNHLSISNSPTNDFLIEMEEILRYNRASCFYLATDDFDVQERFLDEFEGKIFYLNGKKFSRIEKKGMEDALIDLISLSKTNIILGSYYSSFSIFASSLNATPIKIIKQKKTNTFELFE